MPDRKETMEALIYSLQAMRHKFLLGYAGSKEISITPSQGFVLQVVAHGPCSVKDVAKALHITSSAVTQLIDGLVEKGYLLRQEHQADRRVSSLSLSPKAKKLFAQFKSQSHHRIMQLFNVLTDTELKQYAALNKKIVDSLKT